MLTEDDDLDRFLSCSRDFYVTIIYLIECCDGDRNNLRCTTTTYNVHGASAVQVRQPARVRV